MIYYLYLFSLGSMLCLYTPYAPGLSLACGLVISLVSMIYVRMITVFIIIAMGAAISFLTIHQTYGKLTWLEQANKEWLVTGKVISIPLKDNYQMHFDFKTDKICQKTCFKKSIKLRLYLYSKEQLPLQLGETWQLKIRIKPLHGYANPGGLDTLKKWIHERIQATGNIKKSELNRLLHGAGNTYFVTKQRLALFEKINLAIADPSVSGLVSALCIGLTQGVTTEQWTIFQKTGTSHLLAISGLHIGLVAGLLFLLAKKLWRCSTRLLMWMPAQIAAAFVAILGALIYSAMAGFAISTQRALVMITLFMGAFIFRWRVFSFHLLAVALLLVVLCDPLVGLSISFWLSFLAVWTIFYLMHQRVNPVGFWWKYLRMQWFLSMAMLPLSWFFFSQGSLIGFFANFIAIPWVGYFVVPFCLLGCFLSLCHLPSAAAWLWWLAGKSLTGVLIFLKTCSHVSWAVWVEHIPNGWVTALMLMGLLWLLAPPAWGGRYCGLILMLPVFLYQPPRPGENSLRVNILDVGQGLSVVLATKNHVLVYDTGPQYSPNYDAGNAMILPFLAVEGYAKINKLVISHGDLDHIGGAQSLLKNISVDSIDTSVPEKFSGYPVAACQRELFWEWDGVTFQYLYPTTYFSGLNNDSSCVLKVSAGEHSILLTGDIEKLTEKWLVAEHADELASDILIVPHHGSRTSSTLPFIQAVDPDYAIFATGFQNRFGFPHAKVVARYQTHGVRMLNTTQSGMISFDLIPGQAIKKPREFRQEQGPWWRNVYFMK